MKYEIVIGLEVHVELKTQSKIFCSCSTRFGEPPNTNCCPVCSGMPGALPVINKKVIDYAIKAGLATNCTIADFTRMDRKNYFYPDLPGAYQISQMDFPICKNGHIDIETEDLDKRIRINRIHMEEDAGKLVHSEYSDDSLVDYNRAGTPLIEIVTEPDISNGDEAKVFLEKLKAILEFIEVSDCKMQEGSLRADVNLSVRPAGQKEFGIRTEMKNLNSFKAVTRAIEYESKRHIYELETGGSIIQETRRWDDVKGKSYSMRTKEQAEDYRYFPDPNLMPIHIDAGWIEGIRSQLPQLPHIRKEKYITQYNLPPYDAAILTSSKILSDFFEESIKFSRNYKGVSNWIMGELLRLLKSEDDDIEAIPYKPEYLGTLVNLIDDKTINTNIGKKVFMESFKENKDPALIVKEQDLAPVSDEGELLDIIRKIIGQNPGSAADYRGGKKKALGFLMGQIMRETKGKADPVFVRDLLTGELEKKE